MLHGMSSTHVLHTTRSTTRNVDLLYSTLERHFGYSDVHATPVYGSSFYCLLIVVGQFRIVAFSA